MSVVTVAVVQAAPILFDKAGCLQKIRDLSGQAAARKAQLVVFPEAFVPGYPKGMDFGARVGFRTKEGRVDFRHYAEHAVTVPGPDTDYLADIARDNRIHLVVGVIEKEGGTLYCTALTFSPDGKLVLRHRKLMPTASERLVWGFGGGSDVAVAETPIGVIGTAICWENYMPQLRTAYYALGVTLYCAPTVDDRDVWAASMRHIAAEGRCFVLSAVQFLSEQHLPADYSYTPVPGVTGPLIRGGSLIVGPLGTVLAGPVYGEETILTAEIDLDEIIEAKFDLDVVGHYARPDIFQLHISQRPQIPVRFESVPIADDATSRIPSLQAE